MGAVDGWQLTGLRRHRNCRCSCHSTCSPTAHHIRLSGAALKRSPTATPATHDDLAVRPPRPAVSGAARAGTLRSVKRSWSVFAAAEPEPGACGRPRARRARSAATPTERPRRRVDLAARAERGLARSQPPKLARARAPGGCTGCGAGASRRAREAQHAVLGDRAQRHRPGRALALPRSPRARIASQSARESATAAPAARSASRRSTSRARPAAARAAPRASAVGPPPAPAPRRPRVQHLGLVAQQAAVSAIVRSAAGLSSAAPAAPRGARARARSAGRRSTASSPVQPARAAVRARLLARDLEQRPHQPAAPRRPCRAARGARATTASR